jgi:hypothetical protein
VSTPRQRFLDYVRHVPGARPVVSPFLPKPELVSKTLRHLGLPLAQDDVENEIRLSRALDYEPMFMTDLPGLIFPWAEDERRSDADWVVSVLSTPHGEWVRRTSRRLGVFGDDSGVPVKVEADHEMLVSVCAQVEGREPEIRRYLREWRERVGDDGVIVIGHPHVTWLAYQIGQRDMVYHAVDHPETFRRSMEAIYDAALFCFRVAMQEGIDFMSESSYGLEMISPRQFEAQDLPYTRLLADWTHQRGGLFWYHNCGKTRELIRFGAFDRLGVDVIETVAPPPEGDNDLAESRRHLDEAICSKGNLSLLLLRDGSVREVERETKKMVRAAQGYAHIHSTADAVFGETPVENFVAFVRTARKEAERLA